MNMRIFLTGILLTCALAASSAIIVALKYQNEAQTTIVELQETGPVELIWTKDELKETQKWVHKSMEDLVLDAFNSDRGALYSLGMCFLLGYQGIPINITTANYYFAKSASLGFAPALDKIRVMYMEDYQNPFLSCVYLNLVASSGHPEFVMGYHKLRSEMAVESGQGIPQEMEKIAAQKMEAILKNQSDLVKSTDKTKFLFHMNDITSSDSLLDTDYWFNFYKEKSCKNHR